MADDLLNIITGLTEQERNKVFSWVATLTDTQRLEIFQQAVKISYQLKDRSTDLSGREQKYCAFILSARNAGWDSLKGKGFRVADQKQYDDFSNLRAASVAELIHRGRKPLLRKKVLAYWGEVAEEHGKGAGFRAIAVYLYDKRKIKVSASYLAQLWKEVNTKHVNNTI